MKNTLLDLRIGNPTFLEAYWVNRFDITFSSGEFMSYPKSAITASLIEPIKELHRKIGNAKITSDTRLVVGNGATQILQAAMYAMGKTHSRIYFEPPHFHKFPHFVDLSTCGLKNTDIDNISSKDSELVELITIPGNPDGNCEVRPVSINSAKIFDLCYNWPTYVNEVMEFDEDIMVFSLSKATGHAGTRIGWALVKDPIIAANMAFFVEHQTSGVSKDSQNKAAKVIQYLLDLPAGIESCFEFGNKVLTERRNQLDSVFFDTDIQSIAKNGMFAYIKGENLEERLLEMDILGSSGTQFGGDESCRRLNLACSDKEFEELIYRLRKNL